MTKQKLWGKLLKGVIAVSLAASITVPSIVKNSEAVYANTTNRVTQFVDIPAGLYAEKHIYRLSLQGIVSGYLDTSSNTYSFKHNNSISREEAVIMAIRFAGLTNEIDKNAIIQFPSSFTVKNDYKSTIDLAFKKGFLDEKEEFAIAEANPNQAWGSTPASREWVTKLIIRTLGQQELANALASIEPNFYDKSIINAKYLPYVNAAVQLGLVKGVTETTFQPQTPINRASFSTILSRAQKDFPLKHQNQVEGILLSQTDTSITVFADGKEQVFNVDQNTGIYMANNDFAITKSQLVQYGKISVIALNGVAKFVEMQSTEQQVKTTEYEVLLVSTANNKITVNVNNAAIEIPLATTTKLVDSEGKDINITDIKQRDKIQVLQPTYDTNVAPLRVVKVLNGQVGNTITGKLFGIDNEYIVVTVDDERIVKDLVRNPKVTIPNIANATVASLLKGTDVVTVTLNDEDQVTEIKVDKRNIVSLDYAEFISINTKAKILTVSKDNVNYATTINNNTKIYVDGKEIPYESLELYSNWTSISVDFISVPRDIENNIYEYQVLSLDLHSNLTGTLLAIDNTKKIVSMELPSKTRLDIPFTAITLEHPTKTNLTANDLKIGQTYTVILETSELKLNRFVIEEKVSARVSHVYKENSDFNEIIIQYLGNTRTVNTKDITIQKANGQVTTINDVKVDSTISVVFRGNEVKTIILP